MLILRFESMKNAMIYRKLQLAGKCNFEDLEYALVAAFDLLDEHPEKAYFKTILTAGKQTTPQVITYSPNNPSEIELREAAIADWFITPGDEVHFFLNDEYEIKISLEQHSGDQSKETLCLEGVGNIKTNRAKKVDLDEITMHLQLMNHNDLIDDEEQADFQQLLQLSSDLNKLKPWKHFGNEDIVALELEEVEETLFVSVMGAGGQEYGLFIYDKDYGYSSLMKLLRREPLNEEYALNLSALVIGFVDRDDLEDVDYLLIKEHGFSFRGKKNWIQFRSYFPGTLPRVPDADEVEIMTAVVKAMLQLVEQRKNGWSYPKNLKLNEFPQYEVDANGTIGNSEIVEIEHDEQMELFVEINDIEKMQYKRRPKLTIPLEFELMYLQYPVQSETGEVIYPLMLVVMNRQTGEMIANEMMPFPKIPEFCQQVFWHFLMELPNRVDTFYVTKEMKTMLEPVAKKVNIQLVASELPAVTEFKYFMEKNPPFDFED